MGGRCVLCRARGGTCPFPQFFFEANVNYLILTIGPPSPKLLVCPPSFHSPLPPMNTCTIYKSNNKGTLYKFGCEAGFSQRDIHYLGEKEDLL